MQKFDYPRTARSNRWSPLFIVATTAEPSPDETPAASPGLSRRYWLAATGIIGFGLVLLLRWSFSHQRQPKDADAVRKLYASVAFLKINPNYDPLRGDPRFQVLLRRVQLLP